MAPTEAGGADPGGAHDRETRNAGGARGRRRGAAQPWGRVMTSNLRQFQATNARCDMPAEVTVFRDRTGGVVLGLPPWANLVRFDEGQLSDLVDHLSALRAES